MEVWKEAQDPTAGSSESRGRGAPRPGSGSGAGWLLWGQPYPTSGLLGAPRVKVTTALEPRITGYSAFHGKCELDIFLFNKKLSQFVPVR